MKRFHGNFVIATLSSLVVMGAAQGEVVHRQINAENLLVHVSNEAWQPTEFENGTVVPATYIVDPGIVLDGRDDEAAWRQAVEVEVPLAYGGVQTALLKAVYTQADVFIRVRWADDDEDRLHHPWVWDAEKGAYVEGSQVEDSVMLSFEAGCEWQPSFLAGYIFDFDGWHWLAGRSDPLGQALDLYGNVQDQDLNNPMFTRFESRVKENTWNMKFTENADPDLHAGWDELDRVYMLQPVTDAVYYQGVPDGKNPPAYFERLEPPSAAPSNEAAVYPQYTPVRLEKGAGEVSAKGQWEDGFWTVEFRRARITPANTLNDTVFNRTVQFSVHVFDRVETIDKASESKRLFLQFMPEGERLVRN